MHKQMPYMFVEILFFAFTAEAAGYMLYGNEGSVMINLSKLVQFFLRGLARFKMKYAERNVIDPKSLAMVKTRFNKVVILQYIFF